MTILQTLEIPQEHFDPNKLRDAGYKVSDGPQDIEDRILANIDKHRQKHRDRKERTAALKAMPMSAHRRKDLEDRERFQLRTLRYIKSPALLAVHLTETKHIADQLSADGFCVRAAERLGVAKRTVERAVTVGSRLLPDLAEAVAGGPYDNARDLERLAALPLERQRDFAKEAADRRYELQLAGDILADGRLRRLDHETLDWLEGLGRNDTQTRRRLAAMTQREAVETVAQWQRERDQHERRAAEIDRLRERARATIRTTARQTAQAAYDAMTAADKVEFLEVNGLSRALVIRGECISNGFDAVENEAL